MEPQHPTPVPPTRRNSVVIDLPQFPARAYFVGERLDLQSLPAVDRLGSHPLVVPAGRRGAAILFRYGVVVLFNTSRDEDQAYLRELQPQLRQPFNRPETEEVQLQIAAERDEEIEGNTVFLKDQSLERLQLVAIVLGRSVVLAEYEARIAQTFDRIEPFAAELRHEGRTSRNIRQLLRYIGDALLAEQNMVARLEVREKPELLWEHPELEPLYLRLDNEFDVRSRHTALDRKLALVSRTVETVLELLQNRRSLRVEWYIVLLIVFEILLSLYDMFLRGP